jgi:hypothetical protein
MTVLLLIIYIGLFGLAIRRLPYFANSGINTSTLIALLVIKTIVGISYGIIHKYWFFGGDTWIFFEESQRIAATFGEYPSYYIYSLLGYEVPTPAADVFIYPSSQMFWRDLGTYFVVHLNASLIPLSGGVYEVHVVFMAMLSLCAGINLYKVFSKAFDMPKQLLILGCFLLPSLLFWTAGVHKDVILFWGLSLVLLSLTEKRWLLGLCGLLLVGATRHYALALLLPAYFAYVWASFFPRRIALNLSLIFVLAMVGGLVLDTTLFGGKIWQALANRQTAFLNEIGNSRIDEIVPLQKDISLLYQVPQGLINVFTRPFIWKSDGFLQFFAALETILILGIFLTMALFLRRNAPRSPFFYFVLVFSLSYLLLIGLLVANEGTIVRYRAVPLGFLVVLAWHLTDFARLHQSWRNFVALFSRTRQNSFRTYP